jgi:hypothetical protein
MRKGLGWTLVGTVVLSAVALWLPSNEGAPSAVPVRGWGAYSELGVAVTARAARAEPALLEGPLPTAWPLVTLEPAKRDLFAPVVPPSPPAPPPPKAVVAAPLPAEPAAPMAPPMNYRYFGQMRKPDGSHIVYLSRGNTPIQVAVGERLDDGYVVESVTEEGIQLVYPPLGVKAMVNIPPTQR